MAPPETPDDLAWLRPEEAAAYLRVTPGKLELWRKAGLIRGYKVGRTGAVLFRRCDLDKVPQPESPPDRDAGPHAQDR